MWLQEFRRRQQDAPMSDASSWGGPPDPHQTSDVPMPDAIPEAAASSAQGDATMTSAVPVAAAARANRWATEISDEERSQTGDGQKSQAAIAAAEMEEQEREAAAAVAASQEKALQKQKEENALRK